jgi:capsular exopolysaccharide synthesis family protein
MARRKKWVAAAIVLGFAVLGPAAYFLSNEPPRFQSSTLVAIETKPGPPVFQEFAPARPLAVQLAILRSRSLAEAVVEALPRASVEDLIDNPYYRDYAADLQNAIRRLRGEEVVVESPQRRALQELQKARIRFVAQSKTGIVEIITEASKPRVATDIANTYVEVLLSRTRSFNVDDSKATRQYLEQQVANTQRQLQTAEEALRQFNLGRGGVKVPTRSAETVARLSQLENTLAEVVANRSVADTRLQAMKAKLEAMPAAAPGPRTAATRDPATAASAGRIGRLRAKLGALEAQLLDFETKYVGDHPRLTLTRQQIAEVQKELGEAVKEGAPSVSAAAVSTAVPAQERTAFAETVSALETSILSLSAQEQAIREQMTALRKNLTGLTRDEMEYTRLLHDVESTRKLHTLLADKLSGARIREEGEMKVVKIIDPPSAPVPAINQKRVRFLSVALVLAFVIGLGVPAVIEYFNRPVESEADVRNLTGLSVMAAVPKVGSRRPMFLNGHGQTDELKHEDYFLFTEAFRRLRVEIQLLGREMPMRRVLVASALPGEGKSTVVVNLALVFGEVGKHVIVADADFHRPTLHRTLKTPNTKGFSDLLAGQSELREALAPVADGVWLSPRGASSTAVSRSGLGSRRLTEIMESMAAEAEYVLLDSSPILLVPDNLYMAAAADGVLLVVQAGVTRPRELLRAKEVVEKTGTPIIGVVLNQVPVKRVNQYYSYYRAYAKNESRA